MLDAPKLMSTTPTRYARSDDASIAFQVVGEGPLDVVLVLGFATHLELQWELPPLARFLERLSSFSRLVIFDKRGTGLSDPVAEVPTLEQRIDDVRAVMDAAGSERAALFGISEGGPMSVPFAAAHRARMTSLVLYGAMGRTTEAPDYPWASPADALRESAAEFIAPYWGRHAEGMVELFAPSLANDPRAAVFTAKMERSAASPGMVQKIFEMFLDIDVRAVLPTIHVPTLVLHRRGDRVVNRRAGEELAAAIAGARYVELPGIDHLPWAGDSDEVLGEIEEFRSRTAAWCAASSSRQCASPSSAARLVEPTRSVNITVASTRSDSGRAVERCEEAVTEGLHLTAAEPRRPIESRVVRRVHVSPGPAVEQPADYRKPASGLEPETA